MKVTKQQVMNELARYVDVSSVEQIGSKQLFVVHIKNSPVTLLVSYYTIIGFSVFNDYCVTNRRYSVTTSKQLSYIRKNTRTIELAHNGFVVKLAHVLNITPGQASHLTSM